MVPNSVPDGDDEKLMTPRSDNQRKQASSAADAGNAGPPVACEFTRL